jgi:hypothetical protein
MSGYLARLVDRTLSRRELIRPRSAALFGQPVAAPEWEVREPASAAGPESEAAPREGAAASWKSEAVLREHDAAPNSRETVPRERDPVARGRDVVPASEVRVERPMSGARPESLLPNDAESPFSDSPADPIVAGVRAPLAVSGESAPNLDVDGPHQLEERVNHSTEQPKRLSVDRSDAVPLSRKRRVLLSHPTSIARTEAGAGAAAGVRGHAAMSKESELAGQVASIRTELELSPPADPDVIRKTLQGRRSTVLDVGGSITAPVRKRGYWSAARSDESSTVHVTIGTLEVRANTAAAQPRTKPPTAKGPRLGLDEYLRQRRDGGRG